MLVVYSNEYVVTFKMYSQLCKFTVERDGYWMLILRKDVCENNDLSFPGSSHAARVAHTLLPNDSPQLESISSF